MWILLPLIPQEIINQYDLASIEDNIWIYIKIQKGISGPNQAGKISNDCLEKDLRKSGYEIMHHNPDLQKHTSHDIVFTLVVDNFGVNYPNRQDVKHLRNTLQWLYPVTTYLKGSKKLALALKWDYINITVDLSILNYVPEALHKFHSKAPENPQDTPHLSARPT